MEEYRKTEKYKTWRHNYDQTRKEKAKLERRKLREKALQLIGEKCVICGNPKVVFHEIHGKPHENRKASFYIQNYKDFVSLCLIHHRLIHEFIKMDERQKELFFSLIT